MNLVQRKLFDELLPWLDDKRIILIKGARRTGKTTLLHQLKNYLEKKGENTVLFTADQEIGTPFFKNSRLFFQFLIDQYISSDKILYVFIDECQYLPEATIFLKTLHDISQNKIKLIVTGSSSLDLLKIKEPLTGRKLEFTLERFSFSEYLSAQSEYKYTQPFKIPDNYEELKLFYEIYKNDLEHHFIHYNNWGGYPEVSLEKNINKKTIYLKKIIKTYIEKDVAQFFKIGNTAQFNNLIKFLCYQKGQLLNKSEISNTLDLHHKTLSNYLNILEGTFIITRLKPFYTNIRKEISKMPKLFINDPGIIRYFMGSEFSDFASIDGNLVENFAFTHLKLQNPELFYYRTISKAEIDFIAQYGNFLIPIEVKFRKKASTPVALKNFISNYKNRIKYGLMLTQNIMARKDNIYFLPVTLLDFIHLG
ncbi:ATP-binding protein [Desulfovulcanus sp.]